MNTELSAEALEFGQTAQRAIHGAGGDTLARSAEIDPAGREGATDAVLRGIGAWDLEPRRNTDDLEAAAALCRTAGYWALPYPVAERLARPVNLPFDGLVVISERAPAGPVADTAMRWSAVTIGGQRSAARPLRDTRGPRQSAFVVPLELEPLEGDGRGDVALGLILPCWTLLGMLDRALEMTCHYVLGRRQFGQTLASFQGVQFQLTDAEVERAGLYELAKYSLWSSTARPDETLDDAVALRAAAIEAADVVFRVAHQLHGAIGFCDETALSWLSRYSQPLRRLPFGLSNTCELLSDRLGRRGLVGLFEAEPHEKGRTHPEEIAPQQSAEVMAR
jgi:hypothetical protein